MPASIIAIADAVTAELNATAFSQPLTAVRHYEPTFELSAMRGAERALFSGSRGV